ncbi:trichome birefringence-like protein 3, partial [Tanacetum coccineum]
MSLSRDKVTKVPVWVKVHKVPVVAYSEDGLSIIATQLGKPIMLDAFTNVMCAEPYGRLGFVRALIEVTGEKELTQEVMMAIPIMDGEGHTMAKMDVEYEWKPPRCRECLVFGHANEQCPKQVTEVPKENVTTQSDGFTTNIKSTKKGSGTQKDDSSKLVNQNPFDVLNIVDNVKELGETSGDKEAPKETKEKQTNLEYESEVEEMVEINTLANVCSKVFQNWDWTLNAGLCKKGCRIILGWNKDVVDVVVMHQTDQAIHAKVTQKMKIIKKPLRKLMHDHGNLHERVNQLRLEIDEAFSEAKIDEERFLRQKAKIDWLEGGLGVPDVFVSHYESFIGSSLECDLLNTEGLFNKKDVFGADVCKAIHDFFSNGKILKEINHTFMALIPKIATPQKVDIRRRNDTIELPILVFILKFFGFHSTMIKWIMACVTSASFSICINGNVYGYFRDDLFIFAHGDVDSAGVIMAYLDEF